ncbi:hypothetical protein QF028_002883 [Neobacillus sp. B4I6]|uniref:hypothetical protein n=1 Tax=Neobacillus sp. B4I6 TaxID=3373925 RepID=UPI003D20DC52
MFLSVILLFDYVCAVFALHEWLTGAFVKERSKWVISLPLPFLHGNDPSYTTDDF